MILYSGVPSCASPLAPSQTPSLEPCTAVCLSNGRAPHWPGASWVTSCTAQQHLSLSSSIQRSRFPGVSSDLKPTVCCPYKVTSQTLGPGLWLRKHDLMACLCTASWMGSPVFLGHLRLSKAQFSKHPLPPSSLSLCFPVSKGST